ncbi:hypothetical protein [Ferruginibacter albus]|uniref:hypothetical protein n=1 Tax=Ferruginibacter albus TaxID=2875540 RepID=UPI001CC73339|nr:hypothetical protein [Ferruginibacter albus]UAY51331.1 hypothetical protein K9M53_12105 [Ferruginibacter albus]
MHRSIIILLFFVVTTTNSQAQYYFKDILTPRQIATDNGILKEQKIHNIILHSFEADEQPSEGFYCEKKISKDYKKIETYNKSLYTNKSILTTYFNDKGQLIKTSDSSEANASFSDYSYDSLGRITNIASGSHSSDEDFLTSLIEIHQYKYDDSGHLQKMLLIKNKKDTTEIDFLHDEKGNITEEIEVAVYGNHYYYYYDTQNRLTDIVRYNIVKQQMVPDFTYEYDENGQLTQMVAVDEGVGSNYFIWRYLYNGPLKIKEKCYSKDKKLQGYIEYEYK